MTVWLYSVFIYTRNSPGSKLTRVPGPMGASNHFWVSVIRNSAAMTQKLVKLMQIPKVKIKFVITFRVSLTQKWVRSPQTRNPGQF